MNAVSVYKDVAHDSANTDENGRLSYARFNRMSRRGELSLIDWLTGDVANEVPPIPYLSQKNKDWLAPFTKEFKTQVVNGRITRPDDYYQYESFSRIGNRLSTDCEDEESTEELANTPITILDADEFDIRCNTSIDELKPSLEHPIAKVIGRQFEVFPKDLGSVVLQYIRYPVFAEIKTTVDQQYMDEVPDESSTKNYEWDENSRLALIYFITNAFADSTREQALKQFNQATGKGARP